MEPQELSRWPLVKLFAAAAVVVVASGVNTVNQIWHTEQLSPSTEAVAAAEGVAAFALAVLVAVLSWRARARVVISLTSGQVLSL